MGGGPPQRRYPPHGAQPYAPPFLPPQALPYGQQLPYGSAVAAYGGGPGRGRGAGQGPLGGPGGGGMHGGFAPRGGMLPGRGAALGPGGGPGSMGQGGRLRPLDLRMDLRRCGAHGSQTPHAALADTRACTPCTLCRSQTHPPPSLPSYP
jgi:hypothetical protein